MAFYGNITNTSQTTFQFDRIYSNRLEMEVNCPNDGIFVGRYVLVEYDDEASFPVVYKINNKFYTTPKEDANTQIKYGGTIRPASETIYSSLDKIYLNEIVQTQLVDETIQFYKCTGGDNGIAIFEHLNKDVTSTNNYIRNFSIDEQHYNPTEEKSDKWKGFDSTVWVKTTVTIDGKLYTKYVWIADLNSVVPTFDVAADAPTMEPLIPHFDTDSTNVYYKLHLQSPYGFRIKENTDRSDETTTHYTTTYDSVTGKTTTTPVPNIKADIFYNKAAFKYKPNDTSNRVITAPTDDTIKIEPTGRSKDFNSKYSHTTNTGDIQEMTINLPTVGYMISKGWDVIHGENRDDARTDAHDSLQGRLDSFKDMLGNQIPIKRAPDGTFVGTNINGGKNRTVSNIEDEPLLIDDKTQDDAWIKTNIDTTGLTNAKNINNNGISIHHTFTRGTNTTTSANKNDESSGDGINKGKNDVLKLYTPIVDAAGHVVAQNTETVTLPYSYKTITTNGRGESLSENATTIPTNVTIVADNTQDTLAINSGNKWIRIDTSDEENEDILTISHDVHNFNLESNGHTNLNEETGAVVENNLNIPDWEYDKAGHITGKHDHKYTLPFSFKTIKISNSERKNAPGIADGTQTADSTQDTLVLTTSNKWIRLDGDTEDTIIIGHDIESPTFDNTYTQNLSNDKEVTTFEIYDDSFDEAGHFKHRDTITVTMPTGYNTITGDSGTTTASATADTLAITANDIWLQTEVTADKVNITHTGPANGTKRNEANKTPQFGDTFTIEDWSFDSKGHKNELSTHTVLIPKGSLNDLTATTSSVITGLSMVDETGAITQTNNDVGKLALTGYDSATAGQTVVGSGDSINTAIGKLQNQITYESKRINTILTGEDDLDDTINTFKELQDYIAAHGKEAADIVTSINNEISRAQGAETALGTRIDNLDYEKTETENYYISSIKQVNGKIEASNKQIPIRSVTIGSSNGTISVNNSDVKVKGLGSAAYTASTAYATAAQGRNADSAVQKTTTFTYGTETKTIQDLMTIVNKQAATITALSGKINELEQRIIALEPTTGE